MNYMVGSLQIPIYDANIFSMTKPVIHSGKDISDSSKALVPFNILELARNVVTDPSYISVISLAL